MSEAEDVTVRLARLEEWRSLTTGNIDLLRDRIHDHSSYITVAQGRVESAQAKVESVDSRLLSLETRQNAAFAAIVQIGDTAGNLKAHVDYCTIARQEDMAHRDKFEKRIEEFFAASRKRQYASHAMLLITLIGIIVFLVENFVFHR